MALYTYLKDNRKTSYGGDWESHKNSEMGKKNCIQDHLWLGRKKWTPALGRNCADYIMHTPPRKPLSTPLYREGNRALERLRGIKAPAIRKGTALSLSHSCGRLTAKPVLLRVVAPNYLRSRRDLLKSQTGILDLKCAGFEKPEINLDWTRVLEKAALKLNSWYKFHEGWLETKVQRLTP